MFFLEFDNPDTLISLQIELDKIKMVQYDNTEDNNP
jgi:hypothetical protein